MANPTFLEVIGVSNVELNDAYIGLGLQAQTDARAAIFHFLDTLTTYYEAIPEASRPSTYTIAGVPRNVDTDTQRHTFTIAFDMAISAIIPKDEPA